MNKIKSISIRPFRPADLAPVIELIHRTIDICYPGVYPPRAVQFFKEFHSEQELKKRSKEGEIVVAEQGGVIVATGALTGQEILGVFVASECQGHGYGQAIMNRLETNAKAKGCSEVELSVSLPSKGFYERLGYQTFEECSIDVGQGQCLRFWKAKKGLHK